MRLSEAKANKKYKVINTEQLGRSIMTRINDMGLVGCIFTVIVQQSHGPVLVEVRGTRLALGRGISEKINVEEEK